MKIAYLAKIPRILALRIKLRRHGVQHGKRLRGNRVAIKNAGTIVLGDNVSLNSYPDGEACRTGLHAHGPDSVITIGDNCLVNGTMIFCRSSVHIGDNCMFGPGSKVVDNDAHRTSIDPEKRRLPPKSAPIVLHDNVWIGMNALVLKGVEIGRNSVVAAYSVVTKDVPENVLVAGNPAQVVKTLTE